MKQENIDYQAINYAELTKYKVDKKYIYDDKSISLTIKKIDNLLSDVIAKNKFKIILNNHVDELKRLMLKPVANNKALSDWIINILDLAKEMYIKEYYVFHNNQNYKKSNNKYVIDHATKLKNHGLTEINLDKSDLDKLKIFIKNIPKAQQSLNRFVPSKFNFFYNKILRKYKFSEIASNYTKTKMISHFNYTIRHVENNKPKKWSSLDGTITHDLDTLHLDRFCPSVTLLIYLSNVDHGDGPFQYIKGSNQFIKSLFINCLHTGVSFSTFPGTDKPHDYEINEQRALFMQLPKAMQGNLVIGSFINKDSDYYKILSQNHEKVIASKGAVFIFDGHKTLHTGGRPTNGQRLALFQALTPFYKFFNRSKY